MSGTQLISRPVVVLDPGHGGDAHEGGSSPNNASGYNGLLEKHLTLDVANAARQALDAHADVRLTRTGDVNLGLAERAQVARAANASVFVSLHFNGAVHADGTTNADVNGSEAFIAAGGSRDRSVLADAVLGRVCSMASTRNRGVHTRELGTLLAARHAPHTAATLVELSFLTHRAEADKLRNTAYREDLGRAVALGVRDFLARMTHAQAAGDAWALDEVARREHEPVAAFDEAVHCPLLASHARGNNLALRWKDMRSMPRQVDVALHLHGFVDKKATYDVGRKMAVSGLGLQNRSRPTVALMPIGKAGTISGDNLTYEHPALFANNGKGAHDIIRWALDRFAGTPGAVTPARCIYTAHSGGGKRLLTLLATHDPHELHLFDCFYEDPARAVAWMQRHLRADAALLDGRDPGQWAGLMAARGGALRMIITGRALKQGTFTNSSTVARALADLLWEVKDEARRRFLARYYRVEITPYVGTPPKPNPHHGTIPGVYGPQLLGDAGTDLTPAPTPLKPPVNGAARPHEAALQAAAADPPLPPRPANAPGGAAVLQRFAGERAPAKRAEWVEREDALVDEITRGNFPAYLRRWLEVPVQFTTRDGMAHRGAFRTMPDLLSVGNDQDYVIVPLDAISAQRVADAFECLLPTAKMVHDTYRAAQVKHVAIARDYWKSAPRKQSSTNAYVEHDRAIKAQLAQRGATTAAALGSVLQEGHKKLVVIAPGLERPDLRKRLAFYGWYRSNGTPIQAGAVGRAAYAHEPGYADYSHGVRLVHPWMTVDGSPRRVADVLADPVLHRLLSIEGPIRQPRVPATR